MRTAPILDARPPPAPIPGLAPVAEPRPLGRPRATTTAAVMAVGLVAWAAAVDPGGFRPFTTLRWPVLAGVILVATAVGWRERPPLPAALRTAGLAFLAWMALATAFAVDPATAWLGHPQRHLGLVTWVVLVLAFRVGTVVRTDQARRLLGRGVIVAAVVVVVGAALDLVGVGVGGATTSLFGSRLSGWFGQPAYLGAAGVLLAPVALGAAAREAGTWRWVGRLSGGAVIVAVVASQTRGAWIGLAVAALVAWPAIRPRTRASRTAVALGVVVVVAVALVTPLGGRASSAFDLDDGTSRGRLDEWRVAVSVIADHSVLGTGPEGYRIVVPAHLDDAYSQRYGREVVVDRAHDGVLDVAVTGGLLAAALYVALVVFVLVRVGRARRSTSGVVVGAAAAVAGFVAQQLVLFPVAEIDPVAWLLAGVVVAATTASTRAPDGADVARAHGDASTDASTDASVVDRGRRTAMVVVVAGVLILLAGVVVGGALDVAADRQLAAAMHERGRGDQIAALAAADRATVLRPDDLDTWYVAADVAASGESLVDVDAALDRIEAGLGWSPRDPALLDRRELLLTERALRSGLPGDLDRATETSTSRIGDDPANPAHARRLGLVLLARDDRAGAVTALERALALDPDDIIAQSALDRIRGAGT